MAIYAADIQINVKNKGDLRTLESRFKKINIAAVSLNKTLKGLGRRNAIKVDTRAAMSAISALEARIRGLNRTVNIDARTKESRSGGGGSSGAAMPIIAASLGNTGLSSLEKSEFDKKRRVTGGLEKPQEREINQIEKQTAALKAKLGERSEVLARHRDQQKKLQDQLAENGRKFDNAMEDRIKRPLRGPTQFKERQLRREKEDAIRAENKAINHGLLAKNKDVEASLKKTNALNKEIKGLNEKARAIENTNRDLIDKLTTDEKVLTQQDKINRAETALGKLEAKRIQTGDRLKEVDEALTSEQKKLNTQLKKQENQLKKTTGRKIDYTKGISKGKQEVAKLTAQSKTFNQVLQTTDKRILKVAKGIRSLEPAGTGGIFGKMMGSKSGGAALRGGAASMALIPGVAPLAVGGFAGASNGGGLKGGAIGAGVAAAIQGTAAMIEFAKASANVAAEMDRMRIALGGVVPDQESYNTAIDKVSKLSNKYAISQRQLLKGFTQLQASADAAGFDVEDTGKLMEGLLARTLASGKGIEEFKGVMLAASQILSKGKLQAEEARGQIGERIPGFMADLAASMNISMKELDKAMEQGEVTLKDFFKLGEDLLINNEKIATQMAQSYANAGGRLNKAIEDLQIAVGGRSMIIGAKFQNMAKVIVDAVTEVIKILNAWRIAELKLTIAIGRTMQFIDDFAKGRLFDEDRLKEGPNEYLARDIEELRILTGEQEILTKAKKDQIKTEVEQEALRAASWEKIESRLRTDIQYQRDLNSHGSAYAETQRQINELLEQFPDKSDEVRKLVKALKDVEEEGKSAKAVLNDWLDELEERLKELKNPMEQFKTLVEAAGDSFQSDFKEMIRGTKSVGDAMVNMFNRIADAYLDMVAEMIAAQAKMRLVQFVGNMFSMGMTQGANMPSKPAGMRQVGVGASANNLNRHIDYTKHAAFASGGYVDRPTNALIGESGPEYVLRDDQMQGALARYASGQRGQSVIPGGSYSDQPSGGVGGVTVAYTGPTLNFNGDEYVPKSSVPQIINAAAKQGASAGQAKALSSLKNSRSARSRVGI